MTALETTAVPITGRSKIIKSFALFIGFAVLCVGIIVGGVPAAHAEADVAEGAGVSTSEIVESPAAPIAEQDLAEQPATESDAVVAELSAQQSAAQSAEARPMAGGDAPYTHENDSWWNFPEPILSGRPQVGKTLSAKHVAVPAGAASVTYQWYSTDVQANAGMVKIPGATGINYTPTNADVGNWLTFQIRIVRDSTLWTKFGLSVGPIRTAAAFVAPASSPFGDVAKKDQFYKPITWMKKAAVTTGNSAGNYMPKDGVSREAMAAFIFRFQGILGYAGPATSPFADVKPGDKFYNEIAWMYETGLSTGVKQKSGKPKYQPKARVSREAMAAFIYRLEAGSGTVSISTPFKDVKTSDKFYKEIAWMSTSGLSTGIKQSNGKPKYAPKATVSREAMAAFLYRLEGK